MTRPAERGSVLLLHAARWRRTGAAGLLALFPFLACAAADPSSISFGNDVMAVLSKAGCNGGGCHGNAGGKAGFALSLWGEDAESDYNVLTRDQFGRRLNLFDPGQSLILLKATAEIPHEGGKRFATDSLEYDILRRWIADGAPESGAAVPALERIEASPRERYLIEPESQAQIQVRAFFSDGSERDVTRLAVYEPDNLIASVSPDGLAERHGFGEATILVRYLGARVPVRLAFVPARPDFQWAEAAAENYIDEFVFAKLRKLRMNPSEVAGDELFLRRAYLDLTGRLPTAEEARGFVGDPSPEKRARVIDGLLERSEFAEFWALKWADLLRVEERLLDAKGVQTFHRWIRQSIAEGKPMDQFAREIVAARGSTYGNPPANFYRALRAPAARAEATAQVFLGTRLQCAQCHSHPFDRWTQSDYYEWAALFAKVQYKVLENRRTDSNDSHEFKGEQVVYVSKQGEVKNPRTGKAAAPRFLGAETGPDLEGKDELQAVAEWLAGPDNPYFARTQVNRIWFHLMGRGMVEPIDDFRATNPPSHPELLEVLAREFAAAGFSLRHMIRLIMNSRAYQLSSEPNATNLEDEMNFSRAWVRRLTAEQLLDGQSQVAGVAPKFSGYPDGMRAIQLPGARPERRRNQQGTQGELFLEVFGKPPRLLTCEYERSNETTMSQAFQLISGPSLNELLSRSDNRIGQWLGGPREDRELVEELYWTALTRPPAPVEMETALAHLARTGDRRAALEDLMWSVLNAKEFVLRR